MFPSAWLFVFFFFFCVCLCRSLWLGSRFGLAGLCTCRPSILAGGPCGPLPAQTCTCFPCSWSVPVPASGSGDLFAGCPSRRPLVRPPRAPPFLACILPPVFRLLGGVPRVGRRRAWRGNVSLGPQYRMGGRSAPPYGASPRPLVSVPSNVCKMGDRSVLSIVASLA